MIKDAHSKNDPRLKRVTKDHDKMRVEGKKGSKQNELRGKLYTYMIERLAGAIASSSYFEVIVICDQLITDRLEAYTQYLLFTHDLQHHTDSVGNSLQAFYAAIKDAKIKKDHDIKDILKELEVFVNDRNELLHNFVIVKNKNRNLDLEKRIAHVRRVAENAPNLWRRFDRWISKNMVIPKT
jgi:hypothetical protein